MGRPNRPRNFRIGQAPASRPLLRPSDFTYLGAYDVQTNGAYSSLSQGLTHRYVGSDLRFLSLQHGGRLDEFSLSGKSYGQLINARTRSWSSIGGMMDFKGFWWDEAAQRLWSTTATSYTATIFPTQIYTRTLNDDGTVSDIHGPISLQGIPAKRVFGGAQPVPAWFQSQYGVGPYIVGWGGGTSLVLGGGNTSAGLTMYVLPDPAGYANGAVIPTGTFKTIADFAPVTQHRGVRVTIPIDYNDGGDPRPANANYPPTSPPGPGQQWPSPRADGLGWWTTCDGYWNTGLWIDTPTKQGFVSILSAWSGKVYYMTSNNWCDFMKFELHIFDPVTLGRAAQGSIASYAVEPASMIELNLPGLSNQGPRGSMLPGWSAGGATYDPIGKRLYILGLGINGFSTTNRLYVYQVAA